MHSPDYRGERTIEVNPTQDNASLTMKYNAMLQILHKQKTGNPDASLSRKDLENKRHLLKKQARAVLAMIEEENPHVTRWSMLGKVEQQYYAMVLEKKAADICKIEIFRCKKQWCARGLLVEAFKMIAQNRNRRGIRRTRTGRTMPNKIRRVYLFTTID